jgi:hypothetical protein
MNWRKSVIAKKALRYGFDALRFPYGYVLSDGDYKSRPPILANSFPKSGTHLLIQILQAIPGLRDWGLFLASTPSFSFREITDDKMARKIAGTVPSELVSGHLFYSDIVAQALDDKNTVHYFIYRDPRDIVVSEAHYLTYMNTWHKLHKYFKALPNMESRIMFSIIGSNNPDFFYDYPNIAKRFGRYKHWINNSNVFALKFENLVKDDNKEIIANILQFYTKKFSHDVNLEQLYQTAKANINPHKSHTFRSGKSGGWKDVFTDEHKQVFKKYAGQLLVSLGYEEDDNW